MRKLRIPLYPFSMAALATLAACGGYDTVTPASGAVVTAPAAGTVVTTPAPVAVAPTVVAPGTVVTPGTAVIVPPSGGVHPGTGRVESSTRLSLASGEERPTRRLGLRMDDGTVQFVDTQAQNVDIGERVELTADNHIIYPYPR